MNGTELDFRSDRIATNGTELEAHSDRIATNGTELEAHSDRIATNGTELEAHSDRIATNGTELEAHSDRIATNGTELEAHSDRVAMNGTETDVVSDRIAMNGTELETQNENVAMNGTKLEAHSDRNTMHRTELDYHSDRIDMNETELEAHMDMSGNEIDSDMDGIAINGTELDSELSHSDRIAMNGTDIEIEALPKENQSHCASVKRQKIVVDPWELPEIHINVLKWSDLGTFGKVKRVAIGLGKSIILLGCLYFFVCSLDLLSKSFKLIGGKTAGSVFQNSAILNNPVAGLMIGVLATVLLQSSSTTTGIAISLAVSKVQNIIPIVMGANIGTSTTNTIVSMGQITKKDEFRRAFAGATVHDMFNWMAVLVFLPLEAVSGYLYHLTKTIVSSIDFPEAAEKSKTYNLFKTITKSFTNLIVRLDKKVLSDIAQGNHDSVGKSMIKYCCKSGNLAINTSYNRSSFNVANRNHYDNDTISKSEARLKTVCITKCEFMFRAVDWSDATVGVVLLILTLILLSACFFTLVRTLYSVMRGPILALVTKFINANFPGKLAYFTGYLAILIGTGVTMIIQSSSVFTSALTPLVGLGILSLERMYPLTLGANLGTTFTAVIIALSQDAEDMPVAFHVALCHVFFNVSGVLLFYPVPMTRIPIKMAKFLGNETAKYRWFAIVYMLLVFVAFPAVIFGLSSISWIALTFVTMPFILVATCILIINCLQEKRPDILPVHLRTWTALPVWLRSLEPYDNRVRKIVSCCKCFRQG